DGDDLGGGHPPMLSQVLAEGRALETLPHEVMLVVGPRSEREDVDDGAVRELVGGARLAPETHDAVIARVVLAFSNIDRLPLVDDRLHGLVDRSESAFPQFAHDSVFADHLTHRETRARDGRLPQRSRVRVLGARRTVLVRLEAAGADLHSRPVYAPVA